MFKQIIGVRRETKQFNKHLLFFTQSIIQIGEKGTNTTKTNFLRTSNYSQYQSLLKNK